MRPPPSFARRGRASLPALALAWLSSCAAPGGPTGGAPLAPTAIDPMSAPPLFALTVGEVRGKAWAQHDGRSYGLKAGSRVAENVPLQVGGRSTLRLELDHQAQFELAPGSRLVVHRLPRDGEGDVRATWLRLEQGYLRIRWDGAATDPPMQVSFGIWSARLEPGEYFFDTRGRVAAACAAGGTMRLSGVPEWTPAAPMQQCMRLEANKAPLAIAISDAQRRAVRAQRRLHPTLAHAARSRSSAPVARREHEPPPSPASQPAAAPAVAVGPRAPDPTMPAPAASVAIGPMAAVSPPPSVPAPHPRAAAVPAPIPPPLRPHTPPVIVIPAEPEPAAPPPSPPPPPAMPTEEAPIHVVEPARARHTPPVIVIPGEPEIPAPAPEPPAVASTPHAPAPAPASAEAPAPPPPAITIPAEPPSPAPAPEETEAPPPPLAPAAPSSSSIDLAEQAPVVIPPPSQSSRAGSTRRAGSATPPSVPLDVAMYSVAAMPDKIGGAQGALIVPPTITHDAANSQWLVNIASYPESEPAREHARLLVSQKLRAGVREQALPDRMSYVVVIEGFATEEAAETAAIDLETHFDLDPY